MIRDKWLSIFAGVLAVAAACFLGIALYIFINSRSGSENGAAGNSADANENVTAQEAAAGADVTAAGETDAGESDVVVRYVDYPHIFNESYVATTDAYVTYDPPQSTFSRFDYDNDGTMNSVRIFSKHFQGEGSAATHQNFTIYLDEAAALEQQTAEYRAAYTYRIKSDGRSLFVVETENVDGTDTTYVYDISSGTAVLTGSVNGGVYVGTVNEAGQSVALQSSEPDGILFGGEAVTRWKVSAEGMLTE